MKKTLLTLFIAGVFMTAATPVIASGSSYGGYGVGTSNCQIIYGGGELCQKQVKFTIEKQVMSPTKGGSFVDSLSTNDPKFAPSQDVTYRVIIKNIGDVAIQQLDVTDTFPQYVSFVSGPGNFDQNAQTLNFTIQNIDPGKTVTYTIVGKTADTINLPQDKTVVCPVNTVKAMDQNGNTASSSTQICVEKNVVSQQPSPKVFQTPPMKTTPSTGPEVLGLIALIPSGLAGLVLRKKSNPNK